MSFLPIVERELRVAARRRLTFWTRLSAAALALFIFGGLQIVAMTAGGFFKAGQIQFGFLKWLSFLFAAVMGIFLTSDTLSQEKREGTLGLLFLTDLRGYDVVFGKLISHSIRAFYGLLAALPVVGLTLMVGGVTGPEFGRVMLVICNMLFFSLSVGLFVSSISRDTLKAMNGTLFILLLFLVGLPWADAIIASLGKNAFTPIFSLASPGYLFVKTDASALPNYWLCLGIQQILSWSFLVLASLCAPRAWQEKSGAGNSSRAPFSQWLRYGSRRFRLKLRRKLFARDPILWLTLRDRWLSRFVGAMTLLVVALLVWSIIDSRGFTNPMAAAAIYQLIFVAGLVLWMSSQACRFFVDATRNGALELILVTPVGPEQIVRSQWIALRRTFLLPALLVVAMQLTGPLISIVETIKSANGNSGSRQMLLFLGMTAVVGVLKFIGNLAAVAWFGMWMGLTTRSTSMAILKTLAFALILPAIVMWFVQLPLMAIGAMAHGAIWLGTLVAGVLSVAKNIFFITWSRKQLMTRFREAVVREGHAPKYRSPPPLPLVAPPPLVSASVAAPPVPTNTEV